MFTYNKGLYVTLTRRMASLRQSIATPEKGATHGFALVTPADCLEGGKSARREAGRRVVVAQNMSRMLKLEWRPTASLPGCVAGEQNV